MTSAYPTRQRLTPRQVRLLAIVAQEGFVSVADSAKRFGVSDMTIRRDLRRLEESGEVLRTHGGAFAKPVAGARTLEPSFTQRERENQSAKQAIGQAAAAMVRPGEAIGLDLGTTALEMARALSPANGISVFTNSLRAALALADSMITTYIPGGQLRKPEMSVCGSITLAQLENYRLDRVFLGISGITADGIFDYSVEETEIKRLYIRQGTEVVVLADGSKFDHWSLVKVAELERIHVLVTDRAPDGALARALEEAGVRVVVADREAAAPRAEAAS
jgi:DeoR family glycerol-3-phosphate regulon repressor